MRMYIETIGLEEEVRVRDILSRTYITKMLVPEQFNILVTDNNGKQINKYKRRAKTLHKRNYWPKNILKTEHLLIQEIMETAIKLHPHRSLTVYCDSKEIESFYNHLNKYSGREKSYDGSKPESLLWDLQQRVRKSHVHLNFKYDVETVKNTFSKIVW